MKIHCVEQGTLEWLLLRLGKPTASDFDKLLTPLFNARDGEMPKTYLYEKVAEATLKHGLPGFTSFATEQGEILEVEARAWYEFVTGHEIRQVGFVEAEDGKSGCSPDGLCEEHGYGLEMKAPYPQTHVRYLMEGKLPDKYAPQVYGSMYVTGFAQWKFLSYSRGLPPFLLTVKRDETIMRKIGDVLADFHDSFTAAMATVQALKNKP